MWAEIIAVQCLFQIRTSCSSLSKWYSDYSADMCHCANSLMVWVWSVVHSDLQLVSLNLGGSSKA